MCARACSCACVKDRLPWASRLTLSMKCGAGGTRSLFLAQHSSTEYKTSCVRVHVFVCVGTCVFACASTRVRMCMYVCVCVCVFVCGVVAFDSCTHYPLNSLFSFCSSSFLLIACFLFYSMPSWTSSSLKEVSFNKYLLKVSSLQLNVTVAMF